jgi:hypothetical protein
VWAPLAGCGTVCCQRASILSLIPVQCLELLDKMDAHWQQGVRSPADVPCQQQKHSSTGCQPLQAWDQRDKVMYRGGRGESRGKAGEGGLDIPACVGRLLSRCVHPAQLHQVCWAACMHSVSRRPSHAALHSCCKHLRSAPVSTQTPCSQQRNLSLSLTSRLPTLDVSPKGR